MSTVSLRLFDEIDRQGYTITSVDQGGQPLLVVPFRVESSAGWDGMLSTVAISESGGQVSETGFEGRTGTLDTINVGGLERLIDTQGFKTLYASGFVTEPVFIDIDTRPSHGYFFYRSPESYLEAIDGTAFVLDAFTTYYDDRESWNAIETGFQIVEYDQVGNIVNWTGVMEPLEGFEWDYEGIQLLPSDITGVSDGQTTYILTGNGDTDDDIVDIHAQEVYTYEGGELRFLAANDVALNDKMQAVAFGGSVFVYSYDADGIATFALAPDGEMSEVERLEGAAHADVAQLTVQTFGNRTFVATLADGENIRLRLYEAAADGTLTQLDDIATTYTEFNPSGSTYALDSIELVADGPTLYVALVGETMQLYEAEGVTLDTGPDPSSVPSFGADFVVGNDRDNTIDLMSGSDTVFGARGDDRLMGRKGADSIDGAVGDDSLFGGEYHDTLWGRHGEDHLLGQSGSDELYGGNHNDALYGGAGNDALFGDGGNDWLRGDAGFDYLHGGRGADVLLGGSSDDTLVGGAGNDSLDGGRGEDVLEGGPGADTLTGGLGEDAFVIEDDGYVDVITDFQIGVDDVVMYDVERAANVRFVADGDDALVTENGVTLLILQGIDAADLVRTDFGF